MDKNRGAQTALRILHYAAPLLVLAYLTCARILATCLLHRPNKRATTTTTRYTAVTILALLTATEVAQAVSYFAESLLHHGRWAPQDCVIYILASIFVYGSTAIGLLENKKPLWHPILGASFVAAVLEVPLAALQIVLEPVHDHFAFSRTALHVARCILLVGACVAGFLKALQNRRKLVTRKSDERAPLLTNGANGMNGVPPKPGYGAVVENADDSASIASSKDSDDPDDSAPRHVKELKAQQQKRLKEAGSWLGYLKGFKIFLPMLMPSKRDRLIQMCLGVITMVLIANRFLNVLVPRQLGIIAEELSKSDGNGVFPWQAVGTWMILTSLNSGAGVSLIKSFAEVPVEQFARKRISSTAFAHVMNLDMAFHSNKNSGELIRAIDQGQALQGFLEFVAFEVFPMFIDLFVAFWYVSTLFDVTMSYILVVVGVAYVSQTAIAQQNLDFLIAL